MASRGWRSGCQRAASRSAVCLLCATLLLQQAIAVSATGFYLTDGGLHRVQKFDPAGNFLWATPDNTTAPGSGDGQV